MFRTLASLLGDWQRAVTVFLGVGAAAGWGMLAVSPAAVEVHNTVRWGKPDIGIDIKFASGAGRTFGRTASLI